MNREYHKWHSPALGREMELLVFGHAGSRVLVFPSRKRRFFEYEDHGMIDALRHPLEVGEVQLLCVDGVDEGSLYCFDIEPAQRIARHLEYERYIVGEVLPFFAKKNPRTPLTAHGCSFGAYHAVTLALRHPQHFARAVGFSGRYDLTLHVGDFHSLFHGFYDDSLCAIMPSHFVPHLSEPKRLRQIRRVRFILVIGERTHFTRITSRSAAPSPRKRSRMNCTPGAATPTASATGGRWHECICNPASRTATLSGAIRPSDQDTGNSVRVSVSIRTPEAWRERRPSVHQTHPPPLPIHSRNPFNAQMNRGAFFLLVDSCQFLKEQTKKAPPISESSPPESPIPARELLACSRYLQ